VLEFLLTKPRLTYLAKIRNPNPVMPDYQEDPMSTQIFEQKEGDGARGEGEGAVEEPAERGKGVR